MHLRFLATHLLLANSTGVNVNANSPNGLPGTAVLNSLAGGVAHWALIASVVGVVVGGVMWGFGHQVITRVGWCTWGDFLGQGMPCQPSRSSPSGGRPPVAIRTTLS